MTKHSFLGVVAVVLGIFIGCNNHGAKNVYGPGSTGNITTVTSGTGG